MSNDDSAEEKIYQTLQEIENERNKFTQSTQSLIEKIQQSQIKADEQALRAESAKNIVEEQSKKTSEMVGNLLATIAEISRRKEEIDSITQSIIETRNKCTTESGIVTDLKTKLDSVLTSTTDIEVKINAYATSVSQAKSDIDQLLAQATQELTTIKTNSGSIATLKGNADIHISTLQEVVAKMNQHLETAKTTMIELNKKRDSILSLENQFSATIIEIQDSHKKSKLYETNLEDISDRIKQFEKQIIDLLPSATSAGLAASFSSQKKRFFWPKIMWAIAFIASVAYLVYIGSNISPSNPNNNLDSVLIYFLHRLPIILPLVWLGVYSGYQYMFAIRMEEEYAFKEAVSAAFEGYKREMKEVSSSPIGETQSSLSTLCDRVIETLSRRPGLTYESKQESITPLKPLIEAITKISEKNN